MDTGANFVKKIGYVGCAIFLGIFVLFLVFCFTAKAPVEGYKAPHDSQYFSEHLDELKAELESNMFPKISGVEDCCISGDKLSIVIAPEHYDESRKAITHYYSVDLFVFEKSS